MNLQKRIKLAEKEKISNNAKNPSEIETETSDDKEHAETFSNKFYPKSILKYRKGLLLANLKLY